MTTTKTKNSKAATTRKSTRGLIPGRRSTPASSRRPTASGSNGLLARVQATLPGTQRNANKSAAQKIAAALGKATSSTTAHKPSAKSMLGILAGGVGAAAVAKRRHNPDPEESPETPSGQTYPASNAESPEIIATVADPITDTGAHHGNPQGPDPAAAA